MSIPDLVRATRYSDSQVRLYDADAYAGFDTTGRYRQPSEEYISAVAVATKASAQDGMEAAGRLKVVRAPRKPAQGFPKPVRYVVDPDDAEMMDAYEGLPESVRQGFRENILRVAQEIKARTRTRDEIGTRRADEDENQSTLPDEEDEWPDDSSEPSSY